MLKRAPSWDEVRAELPQDVQDRLNETRARRRIGEALAELRKNAELTQAAVGSGAEIPQGNVSRMEKSDDMLLSSISRYMRAIGGSVEVVLKGADGHAVHVEVDPH